MRRKVIVIIIACVVGTLTTFSDAGRRNPSGEVFSNKAESLRLAIEDLMQTFGDRYPDGRAYLEKLKSIGEDGFDDLQRKALLANPLVSGQPLLYVVRAADEEGTHHYVEPQFFREQGSALKVVDLATGGTNTIVETAGLIII